MPTEIGSWWLRCRGAHWDTTLAKRIGEKLGDDDCRGSWRRGLASGEKEKEKEKEEEKEKNSCDKI